MKKILLFLMIVCIHGCSSVSPQTHYYLLDLDSGNAAEIEVKKTPVYLESVTLADHLNQPALVMISADKGVQVASYHFWAEGLNKSIDRVLTYDLERACKCRVLNQSLNDLFPENGIRLALHIEQLAADEHGNVLLSGRFRLHQKKQQIHRFRFRQKMTGSGYQSAVAVKRQLVTLLASDINRILSSTAIGQ